MDINTILALVKARLGLTSGVRDTYLEAIIRGIVSELETEKGLELDVSSPHHLMFIVDLATWRYQSRDEPGAMPRHLQYRLHNLLISAGTGAPVDSQYLAESEEEENGNDNGGGPYDV